ncbi:MAG: hypothetical protein ACXACC_02080 [Promethearchaeota archaeon]|jgi:hypothetical protein
MVEAVLVESKHDKKISIPNIEVKGKENIDQYFRLILAGTPLLKFSITDNKGKELYSNLLNVEMK